MGIRLKADASGIEGRSDKVKGAVLRTEFVKRVSSSLLGDQDWSAERRDGCVAGLGLHRHVTISIVRAFVAFQQRVLS